MNLSEALKAGMTPLLILRNYRGFLKLRMLAIAGKIACKKALDPLFHFKKERFLGFTVSFSEYRKFHSLFREMFIRKEYAFRADTPSPVILDCGSNIGMSVLFFKHLYPRARITAFEPVPDSFALLERNIKANKLDVSVKQVALTEKPETVTLRLPHEEGALGATMIDTMMQKTAQTREVAAKGVPLSDFITGPVDFLKMDIEGAEFLVLHELASKDKLKHVKKIVLEFHYKAEHKENKLSAVAKILEDARFSLVAEVADIIPPYYKKEGKGFRMLIYAYRQ
jgi:FkbM family methyltransferase